MKTLQEAFNQSVIGVYRQGKQSKTVKTKSCAYRGADNARCGIGHLIDDKYYRERMEGHPVHWERPRSALHLSGWPVDDASMQLYEDIQATHDNGVLDGKEGAEFRAQWLTWCATLAKRHGLQIPDVSTIDKELQS